MPGHNRLRFIVLLALAAATAAPATAQQQSGSWSAVEAAIGRKGAMQPGDVMKFAFPRSDLTVTVDGVALKPALALGGWVAFKRIARGTSMAMGDLVLTEAEVGPVMQALQAAGIEQTALHNHLLGESPRVLYMHISAGGDAVKIARGIRGALSHSKTPMTPPTPSPVATGDLDTAAIGKALGASGKLNGVVYQVAVPRRDKIIMMGSAVPPSMGVATGLNFQPTGGGRAVATGDFVLTAREVNRVIRALRAHGIAVTAVHTHMLNETPRLFFLHFWGNDNAVTLAQGLRAALNETNSKLGS